MFDEKYTVVKWDKDFKSFVLVRFNTWSTITIAEAYANFRKYENYLIIKTKDIGRVNKSDFNIWQEAYMQ